MRRSFIYQSMQWLILGCIQLSLISCAKKQDGFNPPIHFRCEYATTPLGIDNLTPRLSWFVNDAMDCQREDGLIEKGKPVDLPGTITFQEITDTELIVIAGAGKYEFIIF